MGRVWEVRWREGAAGEGDGDCSGRGRRRAVAKAAAAAPGTVGLVGSGFKRRDGQMVLADHRCAAMAAGVFARCVCCSVCVCEREREREREKECVCACVFVCV
eukprot:COSAG02_NODE_3158_length_7258_cov_2.341528_3_plen_103_part_00